MMDKLIFCLLSSFLVTFILSPIFRKLAVNFGVVDHPETRKFQKEPVPLLGGAAVYLGVMLGALPILLFLKKIDLSIAALFVGATLIFIVSVIDDRKKLSARLRIVVQLLAAFILIISGVRIEFLPTGLVGDISEIVISILWILGITNSLNYLDGIDGLCCGIGAISSFFFAVVLWTTGQFALMFVALAVIGACAGFFPHNLKKQKMFLGDAGSMFIGFIVAGIALIGNWATDSIIKISIPLLILGVPIFDMTFTTIMRYKEKKIRTIIQWLEYAGRDHFHHYLIDLGLNSLGAAFFIFAVNISMGLSAIIITKSTKSYFGVLTLIKGMIMFGLVAVLMVLGRRIQKAQQVKERMGI